MLGRRFRDHLPQLNIKSENGGKKTCQVLEIYEHSYGKEQFDKGFRVNVHGSKGTFGHKGSVFIRRN